jgi:hypothetical protein
MRCWHWLPTGGGIAGKAFHGHRKQLKRVAFDKNMALFFVNSAEMRIFATSTENLRV